MGGTARNDITAHGINLDALIGEGCKVIVLAVVLVQFGSPDGRILAHPRFGIGACHTEWTRPLVQVVAGIEPSTRTRHIVGLRGGVSKNAGIAQHDRITGYGTNLLPAGTLPLIHPYIVYLVAHRHGMVINLAAIVAADGKVQQDVLRSRKGIDMLPHRAIDGLGERYLIQQFVVKVDVDGARCPVHPPRVELLRPVLVTVGKVGERNLLRVPDGLPVVVVPPAGIGKDMRNTVDAVVLHHVNLATRGPRQILAQEPDGRPCTSSRGNLCAHLHSSVGEIKRLARGE